VNEEDGIAAKRRIDALGRLTQAGATCPAGPSLRRAGPSLPSAYRRCNLARGRSRGMLKVWPNFRPLFSDGEQSTLLFTRLVGSCVNALDSADWRSEIKDSGRQSGGRVSPGLPNRCAVPGAQLPPQARWDLPKGRAGTFPGWSRAGGLPPRQGGDRPHYHRR
jgi:hypothetical protein